MGQVHENHRAKVKVTGAENVKNPSSRNINFDRQQFRFYKKTEPSGLRVAWCF